MLEKIKKWMPTKRKIVQLYFGLLLNANLKGFVSGNIYQGGTKIICAPGINCYSCPGAIGACPLGSLQGAFSADRSTLYYVAGILLLYSILFGRMICGWFCPFGLIQDLLYKIKTPKVKKSPVTRILSYLKYVILVFFVFIVPIIYALRDTPLPAFCKYICPAGTIEGGLTLLANKVNASYFSMLGPLFTWKFLVMISIVVGTIFIFRLFCRFICPMGAIYGLFNRISCFGVKLERSKCIDCGLCQSHCKVDIKHVGDQECISCGECIDICPTRAISWKGSKITLKANETAEPGKESSHEKRRLISRIITAIIMLAVLIGAIVYYWNEGSDISVTPVETLNAEQGNEVGDLCYGAQLEIIDENGISTETINPIETGRITIINFWGTWCTPCVNELPYFDQIASEYADSVSVIAVHTNMISDTAPEFIANHYPDSSITFARDYTDGSSTVEQYYTALGGRGTYPYTIILDENGVILKIFYEALEYEDLKEVVDAQLGTVSTVRGNQVGDLCYSAQLEIVDENGISTETIDPTQTGKISIINFWGTWCTPCVNELPYFDQIASEYADSVSVIAVHTNMISDTAPEFIANHYPDSSITFARDYTDGSSTVEQYYTTLGGRGTYPYTIILDEDGMIIEIFYAALEYDDLKEVVESQLAN